MSWLHVDNSPCGSSKGRSGNEPTIVSHSYFWIHTHTHILPVQTLSTKHHRLLPIRGLVMSHSSSNTHNVQVLNCLLTATAARLDQDTASPNWTTGQSLYESLHLRGSCRCWHYENLRRSCPPQIVIQKMSTTTTTALLTWLCPLCQLAMIGSSCHVKLLTASTINMATIYLWFSYK